MEGLKSVGTRLYREKQKAQKFLESDEFFVKSKRTTKRRLKESLVEYCSSKNAGTKTCCAEDTIYYQDQAKRGNCFRVEICRDLSKVEASMSTVGGNFRRKRKRLCSFVLIPQESSQLNAGNFAVMSSPTWSEETRSQDSVHASSQTRSWVRIGGHCFFCA